MGRKNTVDQSRTTNRQRNQSGNLRMGDGAMTGDYVEFDMADGVATLALNRPEKYNAYVPEMGEALLRYLEEVRERDDVRCVVLEGRGDAFSAGGDVDVMSDRLDTEVVAIAQAERLSEGPHTLVERLFRLPVPTVAKVDGLAVGAGASLAIACDVLLASDRTRIGFGFRQVGLSVDSGVSYLLTRLVGPNVAKELIYTGELVDADRAVEIGLFNHTFDVEEFEDEVDAFVRTITDGPTRAFRQSKRLIDNAQHQHLESALRNEAVAQGAVMDTSEHREGVRSFREDRDPQFHGE